MHFRVRSFLTETIDRAADFASGEVPAVISSGVRARDGFILEQRGLQFDKFRQNPQVLYNHDDGMGSSALPIARSHDETFDEAGDVTRATASFDMDDDFAVRVLGKIERGFINATSIRWLPLEHRIDRIARDEGGDKEPVIVFTRSDVLEWSFVTIPSDPNAVILRSDGTAGEFCRDEACSLLEPSRTDVPRETPNINPMSLVDVVDTAHALIEGRAEPVFTVPEQEAAARLYGLINGRVLQTRRLPSRAADETAQVLDGLAVSFRDAQKVLIKE